MNKLEKLQALIGRKFRRKSDGREIDFLTLKKEKHEKYTIITNDESDWITTSVFDIDVLMEGFTEIIKHEVALKPKREGVQLQTLDFSNAMELKGILMENIKKVQENKEYIPQATSVQKSVQTIINLAKIELDTRTKL